eukprot:TRINITY_DN133_c0_g1_i2.p1 TRINITY_DN133_c0_g1~~TRINITY_DN133_c0_g1_i2.p1  ORF type:complete len:658 (+),score=157.42 TRINITY_DN133_c0_g1_i2:68-2041(+)
MRMMKTGRVRVALALSALMLVSMMVVDTQAASSKIKKVVVLMQENRSYDHMFGWNPLGDGLKGTEYNHVSTKNQASTKVFVDKLEPMIAPCDPDHSTTATTSKIFGQLALSRNDTKNATMCGFVEFEDMRGNAKTNYCDVMSMLTPQHVPIMTALAADFCMTDRFFAAHPGPTWPNRLFMISATSAGLTETGTWYHGTSGKLFPQKTIFDQLASEGRTWRNYYNDTPWELFVHSISSHPENLMPLTQFYVDAARGDLPDFSWINPRAGINVTLMQGSNDHHPDHDISLGERLYKDIYEALRASPHWNETLFVITYDEHGGYFDHVPTPLNVPAPDDGEASYPDKDFPFNRLGVRLPTVLISPWIPKGMVLSSPPSAQKPAPNSEYTLTSIIATTRKLLGMTSGPLTKRDGWSATFEQIFSLDTPRTDCPLHLPESAPLSPNYSPKEEAMMPLNGLQEHIITQHANLLGMEFPRHISMQGQVSEWLQEHLEKHRALTHAWKKSKADATTYALTMKTDVDVPGTDTEIGGWTIAAGKTAKFITFALRTTTLCLDYGNDPKNDSRVGVAVCYPSADPDTNRDVEQQWTWAYDSTIRPYAHPTLCLMNGLYDTPANKNLYLRTCNQALAQHWSYDGPTPGGGDSGSVFFGNFGSMIVIAST